MNETEIQRISRMRNAVVYSGYNNPLIAWMLGWHVIPPLAHVRGSAYRGKCSVILDRGAKHYAISGEFNAR